ncbi:hypothetical protein Kpol_541p12 [Vanderwaltozyma polyspora DSM 70294]|uniref:Bul1 N-terminal domain-containing protein n=1 Tax=Vanderwaltozyma polyspora (strain ATCC 22028 / DSM 70294 / BCRC 21397 / CBS 2163 / NBRC 10782 / NRRL Y-8283 / UCD 57-17) TaxID=436907 RepID=A7TIV7_VANPO|nr:uncharacterized protein Kpol_541p12 [Vanderwaltozyma polyspora DSM 70294]EDO17769.1 hypothetical protein Kpol_541p12 [Vanderwaltozyma polyspora DSM 70294]
MVIDSSLSPSRSSSSSRPPLKPTSTESMVRGRQRPGSSQSSWIRSASASSLLRKKRSMTPKMAKEDEININNLTALNNNTNIDIVPNVPFPGQFTKNSNSSSSSILVDLLPSFEMYNTLHRHIPQGNVDPDRHDFPPSYQEVQTQHSSILPIHERPDLMSINPFSHSSSDLTVSNTNSIQGSSSSTNLHAHNSLIENSLHPLSTQHLNLQSTTSAAAIDNNIPIEDDLNGSDNIFIDKLYTLPKLTTPVEVDIRITKHAPQPHEKPEEESILKEYTSGDVIHGYCIIENRSSQPLKFEMFYVTLEAYTSVIDRQKGKRTVKRFLRMVDLSASWSYTNMCLATGVNLVAGDVDYDHSIIGLNNNRVLEPGKKYKKFFTFKLPSQLLDITCKQEQFAHCLLPPSLGLDKYRNNGRYSGIKVNSVLGCGHLGIKGSPILTYDLIDENLSINYTIDARIVGKDMKSQKLNIMKEQVYNIRVIPFGFSSTVYNDTKPLQQLKDITLLVEDRLKALELIFDRLKNNEPITDDDIHTTSATARYSNDSSLSSEQILERKVRQLYIDGDNGQNKRLSLFKDSKSMEFEDDYVEAELNYKMKSKSLSTSNLTSGLFAGLLGTPSSSPSPPSSSSSAMHSSRPDISPNGKLEKLGIIVLTCKVPKIGLTYWSPSLLRKTNRFASKNQHDKENWLKLKSTLPEDEKTSLKKLDIQLSCLLSNNSAPHDPPEIQSVTTELICVTAKSDNSIPIKLDSSLLMNDEKIKNMKRRFADFLAKIKEYNKKFNEKIVELNDLYNSNRSSNRRELKFTDFVSSQIYNDVESLANIEVNTTHLNETFKKQIQTLRSNNDIISPSMTNGGANASRSSSATRLSTTFSGSNSNSGSKTSISSKFTDQIIHRWIKKTPSSYKREVSVNLEYNPEIRETLVPSFESCLCCRFYCVRVSIKFDHHVGVAKIDIPVTVKNFME